MPSSFADRLVDAVQALQAPVCVGLDPVVERLPAPWCAAAGDHVRAARALTEFGAALIETIAPLVPAIKINSAFFERHRSAGLAAHDELVARAAAAGLVVIGDSKRGDVGHSAAQYCNGSLGWDDPMAPHAVTVHSYLGRDAVAPYLDAARELGRGVFVLVQTSNHSAGAVQAFAGPDQLTLSEHVAGLVDDWAGEEGLVGASGYSAVGAVVAPQDPEMTRRLRARMPRSIFLVPGYGAQGGTATDVAACFKPDGTGALINASRSIIYAYEQPTYAERHGEDWQYCVADACRDFINDIRRAVVSN